MANEAAAKDIIFVFPGLSGAKFSDVSGLLACEEVRDVFAAADGVAVRNGGTPLRKLLLEGSAEDLVSPENALSANVAFSLAVYEVVKRRTGLQLPNVSSCIAGYSIGQCAALYAAGSLSLEDTFFLVRECGKIARDYKGAMGMVTGPDAPGVMRRIVAPSETMTEQAYISNFLTSDRVIVSGHSTAIGAALDEANGRGLNAICLPINVPFHSPLAEPISERMKVLISSVQINNPVVPLISNVDTALLHTPDAVRNALFGMASKIVDWQGCMLRAQKEGVRTIVECGGSFLSLLARQIHPELTGIPLSKPDRIERFIGQWQGKTLASPVAGG